MQTEISGAEVRAPERDLLDLEDVPEFVRSRLTCTAGVETVPLRQARGRVLAGDVLAPIALPPFDHAAVDGYALGRGHLSAVEVPLPISGHVRAGDVSGPADGSVVRIFTGAPVHDGIAAVVMQENVARDTGVIRLAQPVRAGANIRRRGEDIHEGEGVLRAGCVINTGHIGLLAALGIERVVVRRHLSVGVIAFGSELVEPGLERQSHQIYDSNSSMAAAFFERNGCRVSFMHRVRDDPAEMRAALERAVGVADIVVTSGGMAVGDEDHTRTIIAAAGGLWHSVGIKMRPGKPASLATVGSTAILGLPGNPFAALVSLVVLGLPILGALEDRPTTRPEVPAVAGFALDRSPGRAEFFPARIVPGSGTLTIDRLGKGGSARLKPLAEADGLGLVAAEVGRISAGHEVAFISSDAVF